MGACSGGLEQLFGGHKCAEVDVPSTSGTAPVTIEHVIAYARDNLLQERPELFMKGNTV